MTDHATSPTRESVRDQLKAVGYAAPPAADRAEQRTGRPRRWPLLALGAVSGLAWAAGLRGWMIEVAGADSSFSWLGTFALVLLPGLAVGLLLGWAEQLRRNGGARRWRLLAWSPLLLATALADPAIFAALIQTGMGGGALGVVTIGLTGGYALSPRGRGWLRVVCGVLATALIFVCGFVASEQSPLSTPRGLWVASYVWSLLVVLCLACSIPRRPLVRQVDDPGADGAPRSGHRDRALLGYMLVGAACGLAWASSLRAFMSAIAQRETSVEWVGTFVWILLPSALIGALLGWAELVRRTGGRAHWRWLALSPLLFAAVLFSDPMHIGRILIDGIGGGAIGVPAFGIIGGYALSGRGPRVARITCGVIALASLGGWAVTASSFGPELALTTPHGAWATLLYTCLLATLAIAAAIPHRDVVARG